MAWSSPSDLRSALAAAHAIGGTVTDLHAAALAGALRQHLLQADPGAPLHDVHALVLGRAQTGLQAFF